MKTYDLEDLYSYMGLFGNFQVFAVVMYTIGERFTAGMLDFQLCEMDRGEWDWSGSRSNLVTQYDLVCTNTYKISLGSTLFFTSYPLGSLCIGILSDYIGRKRLSVLFLFVLPTVNCVSALLSNYSAFLACRLVEGFAIGGLTVAFYPLIIEFIGAGARNLSNAVSQCGYGLGMAYLCFVGYYITNWRAVIITSSSHIFLIGLIVATQIPESPRYLLKNKEVTKAKQVMRVMARWNKVELPQDFSISDAESDTEKEQVWTLLTYSRYTLIATLAQIFIWFTSALYFFVLSFNMNDMMGNPYINLASTGLMEIIINMLSYFVIDKLGRKWCLLSSFGTCGAAVGICMFLPQAPIHYRHFNIKTFMVIVGRAVGGFIYSLVYLYSAEIFPTTVRASGLGMCVFAAQISSLIAPFVIVIHESNTSIIYLVLLVVCILAFGATWLLPETKDRPLPRSISEMDAMRHRDYAIFSERTPLTTT